MKRALAATLLLGACTAAPDMDSGHPLGWISGCWENADGDYREVWSAPDHGYLFGYALALKGDAVTFFEQSRIDPGAAYTFNAYPAGKGPARFTEVERGAAHIVFADADHDYPQRIRYAREGNRMTAEISLLDGSKGQGFAFRACQN
ncbi:putative lipoprotein [Hyphomonas adhaerens MHS-3]|uniref:Putative lipoprotein n=1 Tax=Hyphomonas adhaerens MHS-3 TaxID=1280949 RepID=A0A069E5X5_9PROT|nr:DUF6265 family protein [Hyphomonas adhaerens]KCZ85482.1 putative lipoprotein [Hyphomonas adhaerens MHS-3]